MSQKTIVGIVVGSFSGLFFLLVFGWLGFMIVRAIRAPGKRRAMLTEAASALGGEIVHVDGAHLKAHVGDFLLEVTLSQGYRSVGPSMGIKVTGLREFPVFLFFSPVQPDVVARIASGAEPELPPSGHRLNSKLSFEGRPTTAVDPILALPGVREMLVTAASMPNLSLDVIEDRVWILLRGSHDIKDGKLELERIRLALRLAEAARDA